MTLASPDAPGALLTSGSGRPASSPGSSSATCPGGDAGGSDVGGTSGVIVGRIGPAPRPPIVLDAAALALALRIPDAALVAVARGIVTAAGLRDGSPLALVRGALSTAELAELEKRAVFDAANIQHRRDRHTGRRIARAADYVRACLVVGDHQMLARACAVAAAQAAAQAPDAVDVFDDPPVSRGPLALDERIVLDGRPYRVTAIEGRAHHLIGKRGGRARLVAPDPAHEPLHPMLAMWTAWIGARKADHHCFRRDRDGYFVEERSGKARR